MQKSFWWWQCSDRYIISLFPHLHTPFAPLFTVPNKLCGFCGRKSSWKKRKEQKKKEKKKEKKTVQSSRAVNVEVAVPDSLSPISPEFSVEAKQHWTEPTPSQLRSCVKLSRGGRPRLPVPNKPWIFCGGKATLNRTNPFTAQELCKTESRWPSQTPCPQ